MVNILSFIVLSFSDGSTTMLYISNEIFLKLAEGEYIKVRRKSKPLFYASTLHTSSTFIDTEKS